MGLPEPWWVLRLRHASPVEWAWRLRPRAAPRACPSGPPPRWPWPLPQWSDAPDDDPAIYRPQRTVGADPKPLWARHQLHGLMQRAMAGQPVDVERWWQAQQRATPLWSSPHAVAGRVPALALLGHREALWAHVDHLRRHPSRFSSANNHRVAELAAWSLAARCMPDLPRPAPLRPVLEAQLHADGWGREQSVAYLAHVLEWGLIAHRCGEDLAELLHRGARALEHTLADDGSPFAIGDNGGDIALPGGAYAHDVAGCVRSALGQPALHWTPGLRAALLGLGAVPAAAPPGSACFEGLTVLRSPRLHVAVDHGPLGMPPLAGHGHDDLLAVWAHRDGRPWLVGRGTSAYHDAPIRRRERGATGTCGLRVDGGNRAMPHSSPFLWSTQAEAVVDRVRIDPHGGQVVAHHDAYDGIRHTRTVAVTDDRLVVHDRLDGRGMHHVAIRWHLAPGIPGRPDGDALHALDSPLPVRVEPVPHALTYGQSTDADTLIAEGPVRLPCTLVSTWRPRSTGTPPTS